MCIRDCSTTADANSAGTHTDANSCQCGTNYHWQTSTSSCITCDSATTYWDQNSLSCLPNPVCGDGATTAAQTCDDGNAADGDGCSSTCQTETGYTCTTTSNPSVCNLDAYTCGASSTRPQLKLYYIKYGSNYLD